MITIKGEVIHGAQLGRRMGFPTANIDARDLTGIENGVYRSQVTTADGTVYRAMSNIGIRPSVDGRCRLLETHLFGFSGDLYGHMIKIELIDKIRDEIHFASIDELRNQLELDADLCRRKEI